MDSVLSVIWPRIEPELISAGREGESIVARARLILAMLIFISPIATLSRDVTEAPGWMGLLIGVTFGPLALIVLKMTREREPHAGLGLATAIMDVSFATAYHALVFVSGWPIMALTSRATFALYLLAITASCLRYDGRVATLSGVMAGVQWLGLVGWARAAGYAESAIADGRFYGDTTLLGQAEEITMIAATTTLAHIVIRRGVALRLSSIRDGLTGLLNRSHFEERLVSELLRAARYKRPVSVAILDLDMFKQVNDTQGHLAGDRVLREVADRLRASVRRTDLVARFGGDEFAILLPETDGPDAQAKLNEIRDVVDRAMRVRDGVEVTVTLSAGMAVAPQDGHEATELVALADARLMAAKRAGRNRVVAT